MSDTGITAINEKVKEESVFIAALRSEGEGFNANMYRLNGDWMRDTEVVVPGRALAPGRQRIGGRDLEFMALGGHTVADLVVVDHDSGTVFAADLVFNGRAATTPLRVHCFTPRAVSSFCRTICRSTSRTQTQRKRRKNPPISKTSRFRTVAPGERKPSHSPI